MAQLININKIKKNPNNPRFIRDEKFLLLVKSLQDFPEMMELTPVVVNKDMMILGGNMRLEAAIAAGWKKVPCEIASKLTPEQEREFIIKDNVQGGEWDFDKLANEWDETLLKEWAVDIPKDWLKSQEEESGEKPEFPIVRKYNEKYNAFIIISENETDEVFIKTVLGFGKMKSYQQKKTGQSFVITAKDFILKWNVK